MEPEKKRMIERRKFVRIDLDANTKCKIEQTKGKLEIVRCSNISPEGLCITLNRFLERGTIINANVTMKGCAPVSIKGEVVWSNEVCDDKTKKGQGEFRTGIKVLDIKGDRNRFLLQLCDAMVKKLGKKYPKIKF
jgi:hypothetical protein